MWVRDYGKWLLLTIDEEGDVVLDEAEEAPEEEE